MYVLMCGSCVCPLCVRTMRLQYMCVPLCVGWTCICTSQSVIVLGCNSIFYRVALTVAVCCSPNSHISFVLHPGCAVNHTQLPTLLVFGYFCTTCNIQGTAVSYVAPVYNFIITTIYLMVSIITTCSFPRGAIIWRMAFRPLLCWRTLISNCHVPQS